MLLARMGRRGYGAEKAKLKKGGPLALYFFYKIMLEIK
jgi:hypothetical protein